jgi:hypothetical protein
MKKYQELLTEEENKCVEVKYLQRQEFFDWCRELNIICEYDGSSVTVDQSYDTWYIADEKHLMWAKLRWS